ncbi:Short-chain dehydrogenase [Ekhidna lutea]|uniref:Short-chain dehydrogenase n=1 Tax=Ekhidna lutea TaxID=447679 RepID=A0A239J294_EKHLU|nr:SDR family oxidoreductase [Ekhidna lutea]SNS99967.1 Short-chain dehydrogenase [Ekhidna lutea]
MQKVAIITGGSSGIGKSLTLKYANEGYAVVFTGRNSERMSQVANELGERPHLALELDAADKSDNQKMVEETIKHFGRIDVLICNAGISMRALFEEVELEVFKQLMDINFYGAIYATKFALPHLLESQGTIIAISSINGWRSTPARTAYSSSKFAMQGFFEALRTEVMTRGVNVLVVCPGFTSSNIRNAALTADGKAQGESPRNEKKMMTSDEVAERTFRAAKKKKRDLILTFEGKMAVFLNKVIPSRLDRMIYNMMKKEPDNPLK